MSQKRILTGIKPTGDQLHLGNYFGALKPMIQLGEEFQDAEIFVFIANMHALTQIHDQKTLSNYTKNIVKGYLACGLDPERFIIFNQSDVAGHAQLSRVLQCLTNMGYMERMHAYKDALQKGKGNEVNVGTFSYPILMASDIILYDANLVPVGKDQKQHLEFARDIASKFNHQFGETFILPDPYIQKGLATVPGIDGRKMSKSYNNFIPLFADEKIILKKIKQIATDTKSVDESKNPDECNVYNIAKLFLNEKEDKDLREKYIDGGLSYKYAKDLLFEKLWTFLSPIQKKYNEITDSEIEKILEINAQKANLIAEKKIKDVYDKIGFNI